MRQSLVAAVAAVVMGMGALVVPASVTAVSASAVAPESSPKLGRDAVVSGQASVSRIAGENRYGTAARVATAWPPQIEVAYVVGGADFPDAMTAAARAGVHEAPVLLTGQAALPPETKQVLTRLQPRRVVVVGGARSVSPAVVEQLRSYATSRDVARLAGSNRYGTATAVADLYPTGQQRIYVASGQDFPDGLAGAALAAHQQVPLLLTRGDTLDDATRAQLQRLAASEVVVLGGRSAVTDRVAQQAAAYTSRNHYRRLGGADRYETAAMVAQQFPPPSSAVYVASGQKFPDALVGAALAGRDGVPLLLTKPDGVPTGTDGGLAFIRPSSVSVLGGEQVVRPTTVTDLGTYPQWWQDGEQYGRWEVMYNGWGEASGDNRDVILEPRAAERDSVTHGGLVATARTYSAQTSFSVSVQTLDQVRQGKPNPWEVGWVLWNHSDDDHFYAVALKPNGWEVSKQDPAYPGAQRYLKTGSSPTFPVGETYRVSVEQSGNTSVVSVDGKVLTRFTDRERPYTGGAIGLYTEDARVRFTDLVIQDPQSR